LKQILSIGLAIFVIATLIGFSTLMFLSEKRPPKPDCRSVHIQRGIIQSTVYGMGTIKPKQLFHIKAKRPGKIADIMVKTGEKVTEKQRLVRIEPEPGFVPFVDKLQYDFYSARLHRLTLTNNLNKQRKLFKRGMVAQAIVEEMERNLTKAAKEENLALERLKALEEEIGQPLVASAGETARSSPIDIYISAPSSGTIVDINKQVGDLIGVDHTSIYNQDETGIIVLADLSELFVETKVNELDIKNVQAGQSAIIRLEAQPEKAYPGVIEKISSVAFSSNQSDILMKGGLNYFAAVIKIEDPDTLVRPGMTCNVQIVVQEKKNILTLPVEAVFKETGQTFVFYETKNAFEKKAVSTGISDEHRVEITSGLNDDDTVCDRPLLLLEWRDQMQRYDQRNFVERLLQ
jgi:HlyD family secretion protein